MDDDTDSVVVVVGSYEPPPRPALPHDCHRCGERVYVTLATWEQIRPVAAMCEICTAFEAALGSVTIAPLHEHPNRERFDEGALEMYDRVQALSGFLRRRNEPLA